MTLLLLVLWSNNCEGAGFVPNGAGRSVPVPQTEQAEIAPRLREITVVIDAYFSASVTTVV
jgi:hypothetical protein